MKKNRLIIADENEEILNNLEKEFTEDRFEIVGRATDGEQLLNMVKTMQVDVIITDIVLPKIDAYSVLDYIKIHRDYREKSFLLGGLILDDRAHRVNDIFVDSESLKQYYKEEQKKNVSIRRLKREIKNRK